MTLKLDNDEQNFFIEHTKNGDKKKWRELMMAAAVTMHEKKIEA